ncbi:Lcl domain-containing protein [Candidatus Magnetobacterium casense]|uniref:Lcl domain-containing protein n=1 Tax=Candidatus Magnetobacterium casense TaxID=1455061 RepID=UPI00058DA5C8|nr:DUF1566 domain-containing protein [Candidatus Magnetobacterium casensis]
MNIKSTQPRFSYLLLVILTAAWLILPCLAGAAHAGTVNLPQTGQTTTYAAGDDGALQKGVAWPNPRFTDNRDQTMTDNLTGLVWAKDAGTPTVGNCAGGSMDWQAALDYVACLNAANYLGYSDWRLPNVNELESVINAGEAYVAKWLNAQGFINLQSNVYWSSTSYSGNTSFAWRVHMDDGGVSAYGKSYDYCVWPVRSGQSGPFGNSAIWSTGQTKSYAAGDDGALQKGVVWPSPRFTDNGDQTVTDNLTGLMWTKNANLPGTTKTLQEAIDYVASMNSGAGTYGFTDWRLPNRKDLRSLSDYGNYAPPLPRGHPSIPSGHPFTNVQYGYWSSTSYAPNTSRAWRLWMSVGDVVTGGRSDYDCVWPVRSGLFWYDGNTLAISLLGTGGGTVTASAGTITWNGNTGTASYTPDTTVTLTAQPDMTSTLGKWSGCNDVSSGQCTIKMTGNRTLTVTFDTINGYPMTVTKTGFGDGTIATSEGTLTWNGNTGTALYKPDTEVVITANPDTSSKFAGWTGCSLPLCIVEMTSRKDITAKFNKCSKARKDFDGDGKSDILWQDSVTGDVAIWLMDGTAINDRAIVQKGMPSQWQFAGLGDLNGDGSSDIVWQDMTNGDIYGWLMDGIRIVYRDFIARGIPQWQIKAVADYNGDSKDDVYLKNADPSKDVIFLMNGLKPIPKFVTHKSESSQSGPMTGRASGADSWDMKATGDYNGDGMNDMVWQDGSTGDVYMWTNDGTGSGYIGGYVDYGVPADWSIY